MIEVTKLKSVFEYNGIRLTPPVDGMSPEEVKDFFSGVYPELTNANITDPEISNGTATYKFQKAVGTKG